MAGNEDSNRATAVVDASLESPIAAGDATPPTPYRPLLWLAVAVALGAAADYCLAGESRQNLFGWWWGSAAASLGMAHALRRRGRDVWAAALVLLAAGGIGGAWQHWRWNYVAADDLGRFARETPQPACVEVVLVERVTVSPPASGSPLRAIPSRGLSEAVVRVEAIRDGSGWRPAAGQSRLRVAGELRGVVPGDRLRVFAQLGKQPPPLNPGQYDWAAAERREGRLCELYCIDPQCVAVEARAPWASPSRMLHSVRTWCSVQLAASVETRDAPLVWATLLGDQELLSDETKDAFLNTGAIHLLVISGAHVAMLASIVWGLVRSAGAPSRLQLAATLGMVMLYAAIVGHEPSVTRATILTVAMLLGLEAARRASAGNLLGAAALVVLAINPSELFRSGTQFSFLAVAALMLCSRRVIRERQLDPLARLIAEARPWPVRLARRVVWSFFVLVVVSMAVGAAVTPLVAYHFHVMTPASVLLTPLASPLVGVAIAAGLGAVTAGWLLTPLGQLLGAACGGALHLTEWLVQRAAEAPGAFSYCASPGAWWLCGLYGAAGLLAAVPAMRPGRRWAASALMSWLAVGYASLDIGRIAPSELRATFLAVGHGTCVVLELPSRQTILYDAGSLGSPEFATQTIASFLWSRGIDRIDAIVLSHADNDHYNAAPGLLERFPVGVVYVSPMMFNPMFTNGDAAAPDYLRQVLREHGVPLREVWMNDRLRTADAEVKIEVLHPPEFGMLGRDNANSILLSVDFAGRRILLPGDLESPGIERVMADPPLDCDVLLAPHHGSELSDPPGFAAWSSPEWVVMSGRQPERTLVADLSYQQAGAEVFHTSVDGAVTCKLSAEGVRIGSYRSRR
jgi:competence protein ComEC